MNTSMIRCPSCWEGLERDTERCPRCGARVKDKAPSGRKFFGFAFWRNCALLLLSLVLLVSFFLPMFREEVDTSAVADIVGEEHIRIDSKTPIKFEYSAFDMLVFAREAMQDLPEEELEKNKYVQQLQELLVKLTTSFDPEVDTDGVTVVLKDKHIRMINEFVEVSMHVAFLTETEEVDDTSFWLGAVASLVWLLVIVTILGFALVNMILNLCGCRTPYGYLVRLVCLALPVGLAYCAIMYTTAGFTVALAGAWVALAAALIMTIGVGVIGLLARREHSLRGILTRGGTLLLAAAMIVMVFTPMLSLSMYVRFSDSAKVERAQTNLPSSFYTSLNITVDEYEALRKGVKDDYTALTEMKKEDFVKGDKAMLQIHNLSVFTALCADQAQGTTIFSYIYIPLVIMCVFAALVMWQSLCYLTRGRDMKHVPWFFRGTAAVMMLVVFILNIVFVCVANAGADGTAFFDSAKRLGDYARLRLGGASIVGTILAIGIMFIPHGSYTKCIRGTARAEKNADAAALAEGTDTFEAEDVEAVLAERTPVEAVAEEVPAEG